MISHMTEENWRQANMAKATAARVRRAQERQAEKLRAAGWTVTPPEEKK
jgi:hypothetical protein